MKLAYLLGSTCVFLPLISGCDRNVGNHEIIHAGNQTFLLDKATGKTDLIEDTTLVPIRELDTAAVGAKSWPVQTIPQLGNVQLTIRTKYRDGHMLYAIDAMPFAGSLEKAFSETQDYLRQPTIYLDMYDIDGFQTGEPIALVIRGATRVVDEKGKVHGLSWNGSQPMSSETYKAAATQSVTWAGFDKN